MSARDKWKEIRTHVHPWRGREYLHTKYEKPDGKTTWLWSHWKDGRQTFSLDGVELPLWRHEKLDMAGKSDLVLICEGEKDVETAEKLGFLATSTPSGALKGQKRWLPLYTKYIARFDHVAVLQDNDATGKEHAERCAGALHGLIRDLTVIQLPGLLEHGDFTDWVDAGHTATEFRALIAAAKQWAPPEWPEPIQLTEVSGLPEFPARHLPAWLREFVEAVAAETLTQKSMPALIALANVATALARKVCVHVRDHWTEPLNIYTAVVSEPATLKTPIFKMACAPLEVYERDQAAKMKEAIVKAENEQSTLQTLLRETRKKAGRAKTEKERKGFIEETAKISEKLGKLVVPKTPQLIATDVTEESLGELLHQNGGRIAVMSDEGGPFRNMAGTYTAKGSPLFEMFKHGHNAGTVRVNRRNHEPYFIPVAAITTALMVQPAFLRGLKDVPEFRGEGLLARFLYAVPDSNGKRNWDHAVGVPARIADTYRDRMLDLLNLPPSSDQNGAPAPHVMELSEGARDMVNPFRNSIEERLVRGGDLHAVDDWAGKIAGEACRIAALLHLADLAGHAAPWTIPVTADAMDSAITIARDFLIPHAVGAFTVMGGDPAVELAEEILIWVRKKAARRFKKRELHRLRHYLVASAKEWDKPLELLEEYGWIRAVEPNPKAKGRPSEQFDVNPAVFGGTPPPSAPVEHGDAWEGPDDGYE